MDGLEWMISFDQPTSHQASPKNQDQEPSNSGYVASCNSRLECQCSCYLEGLHDAEETMNSFRFSSCQKQAKRMGVSICLGPSGLTRLENRSLE